MRYGVPRNQLSDVALGLEPSILVRQAVHGRLVVYRGRDTITLHVSSLVNVFRFLVGVVWPELVRVRFRRFDHHQNQKAPPETCRYPHHHYVPWLRATQTRIDAKLSQ